MPKVPHSVPALPDDVVLRVSGVSKKFCRNLRRSMWYGIQDLSKNLMGFRSNPETADRRLQTPDFSGGSASGAVDAELAPTGGSKGLRSAVCSLTLKGCARQNSGPSATSPSTSAAANASGSSAATGVGRRRSCG